ncbi:MAG TPA: PAS domain S-box protein [Afifellaceae bacterium]|nr:PAS domain S-box protein [Afifellaceae bacterium]
MSSKDRQSLKAQASKLAALLESAVDAIITIDAAGRIESVNPAAERLFHYSAKELGGRNVAVLMPEPDRSHHDEYIRHYLETGERQIIGIGREVIGRRSDGSTFPMHLAVSRYQVGGETFFTGIIHDLSDRRQAETALHQAQRMEAIGQLTGGIAHDFNNLLSVIIGNLELLEPRLAADEEREILGDAQEAAELGAKLTGRLLAFARQSILVPEAVDLNRLIVGLSDMLRRTIAADIDLSTVLGGDLWLTRSDPGQIENAVINLAINARDAMPSGGRLILETRNAEFIDLDVANELGLQPGQYVQLSVTDTGTGMPPEIRDRAIEPFFTTKEAGRGTGLGLPMVYGFARQSGGDVTIYSEAGKGTTVNIYLPRAEPGDAGDDRLPPTEQLAGQGERILVVEDDSRVRLLTLRRLRSLGYKAFEASNGPEALDVFEKNRPIDLVFSDLVMPGGLSGRQLCNEIRNRHGDVRVLLTSGYAEELVRGDMLESERIGILRKPYRTADLAAAIHKVLSEVPAG